MIASVQDFINRLRSDEDFLESFRADPVRTIANHDLTIGDVLQLTAELPKKSMRDFEAILKLLEYINEYGPEMSRRTS